MSRETSFYRRGRRVAQRFTEENLKKVFQFRLPPWPDSIANSSPDLLLPPKTITGSPQDFIGSAGADWTFILKKSVEIGSSRPCFDKLSTNGLLWAHQKEEVLRMPFAPRSSRGLALSFVEGGKPLRGVLTEVYRFISSANLCALCALCGKESSVPQEALA